MQNSLLTERLAPIAHTQASPAGQKSPLSGADGESFADALERIKAKSAAGELITGKDLDIGLGMMALGQSYIDDWQSKGLTLDRQTVINAGKAFNQAFAGGVTKAQAEDGSTAGMSSGINRHQLVQDNQETPDWFNAEYDNHIQRYKTLSTHDETAKLMYDFLTSGADGYYRV